MLVAGGWLLWVWLCRFGVLTMACKQAKMSRMAATDPTTPEPPLAVPADAIDAARELNLVHTELTRDELKDVARRIATPILAAELRRLAEELESEENANTMWRTIVRRAGELIDGSAR